MIVKIIEGGKIVKKGDVLAEFDRTSAQDIYDSLADSFAQQIANVENQRANNQVQKEQRLSGLLSAQRNLESARLDVKMNEILSNIQAEKNQLSLEQAQKNLEMVQKTEELRVEAEGAQLKQQELTQTRNKMLLDIGLANLDKLTVRAPIDGLMVLPPINRGTSQGPAQEGDSVGGGAPFVQIIDSSEMIVRSRVNQLDAAQLRPDGPVVIHLDAYPDVSLPGKILSIAALAQNTGVAGKSKAFAVVFSVDGTDAHLFPDITANVDVIIEQAPNALVVPRGSVVLQAGSRDKGFVFVRNPKGDGLQARAVTLGMKSDTQWAIVSGLNEGEMVALFLPANALELTGGPNGAAKPAAGEQKSAKPQGSARVELPPALLGRRQPEARAAEPVALAAEPRNLKPEVGSHGRFHA